MNPENAPLNLVFSQINLFTMPNIVRRQREVCTRIMVVYFFIEIKWRRAPVSDQNF